MRLGRGDRVQYRLDMARAVEMTGPLTFTQAQPTPRDRPQIRYARPERWGDVVLQRKEVPTSYHLSVVVDDAAQGITYVTRGRDLEAATDVHVLLQMLLGLPSPICHLPQADPRFGRVAKKLAKSRGSTSLRDLRSSRVDGGGCTDGSRLRPAAMNSGFHLRDCRRRAFLH